jgi:hypothetical protein
LDAIAQLASESVPNVQVTGGTLRSAVTALLALQANENPIQLVEMTDNCATQLIDLNLQDTTILAALREMQAQLPQAVAGYFYLDTRNGLHWTNTVGTQDKTIALGERLQGVTQRTQYQDIATRVYAYGEGNDASTRLTLLDAGQAQEYIEDATGIAAYGTLSAAVVEKGISNAAALLRLAQRVLEQRSTAQVEYDIDVLDFARLQDAIPPGRTWTPDNGAIWAEIYVGGAYRLVDSGTGTDTTIRVKRVTHDLANPLPVSVELSNRTYSLSDLLVELRRGQDQPVNLPSEFYPEMVNSDGTGLYDGAGNLLSSDAIPQPVSSGTGSPGTGGGVSRPDHSHEGQPTTDAVLWGGSVTAFPAIPAGAATVIYKSNGTPAQLWIAGPGESVWTPMQAATDDVGTPA